MTDPVFGVVIRRENTEPRPVIAADLSTIGIVGPADDADEDVFPLNTPVKGYSNDVDWLRQLGEDGFLADAVRGINDQLGEMQLAAQIIIVRTPRGVNADPVLREQMTMANIMGSSTAGTGIWALLMAPELVAATPRVVLTPGYTAQLATGVGTLTESTPGAGYTPGTRLPLTFTGGGAGALQAAGYVDVMEDGTLDDPVLESVGAWYTAPPTVTVPAPPAGEGAVQAVFTATTAQLANPVCASLPPVLEQLVGHAVVESAGTSQTSDENWRETLNSTRLIPVVGGVKVMDPVSSNIIVRPFAPRVAGAIIRRDHETGAPFHSAANQPIYGVLGPARRMRFAITSGANEGQALLGHNMGILVAGEIGNDFAIASGGFVFIGTDNAGEDEIWRMYNVTRGRDYIHLSLLKALRFFLGRFNITGHTIVGITNTMKHFLRNLQANNNILGFKVMFRGNQNNAEQIRLGHISISFAAEEPSVLKKITVRSSRYRPAIDAMVAQLESQLNLAA